MLSKNIRCKTGKYTDMKTSKLRLNTNNKITSVYFTIVYVSCIFAWKNINVPGEDGSGAKLNIEPRLGWIRFLKELAQS